MRGGSTIVARIGKENNWKSACRLDGLSELYGQLALLTGRDDVRRADPEIAAVLVCLEENFFRSELTNDWLASRIRSSTVSFRKRFTAATGGSPMRYVREKRMEYAKQLLQDGHISVGEISERCGYANIYYFSNAFKKRVGMSPSAYAKQFEVV